MKGESGSESKDQTGIEGSSIERSESFEETKDHESETESMHESLSLRAESR